MKIPVIASLALGLAVVGAPWAAQATTDTTPPVLHTPVAADFKVGTSLSPEGYYGDSGCGYVGQWANAGETFSWTGSDNSGYVRYEVDQDNSGEPPDVIESNSTVTTVAGVSTNYTNDCGGDGTLGGWNVTASDAAGNTTTTYVKGFFQLFQDDNAVFHYGGSWAVSHCSCWSGLTTHDTSAAKASVSFTIPKGTHHVGIVMPVGPPQGSARVLVDGVLQTTVNTHASSKSPRVTVWDGHVTAGSAHTVKVVNLASSGHPRIDLDAVLTN